MEKVKVISVKPISIANEENGGVVQGAVSSKHFPNSKSGYASKSGSKKQSFAVKDPSYLNGEKPNDTKNGRVNGYSKKVSRSQKNYEDHILNIERNRALSIGNYSSGFSSSSSHFQSDLRASFNERIITGPSSLQQYSGCSKEKKKEVNQDFLFVKSSSLYRSNSSLELDHELVAEEPTTTSQLNLSKREYGSHGSINVVSSVSNEESIYSILESYQSLKQTDTDQGSELSTQKGRSKIHKLWDKDKTSIFKKLLPSKGVENKLENKAENVLEIKSNLKGTVISNSNAKQIELMGFDNKSEDNNSMSAMKTVKRTYIAHYDCQSLAAQLSASRMKTLLADRSNTTTGASAAAMADSDHANSPSSDEATSEDPDNENNRSNHLVSICPYFYNEIGGEGERIVSLSRDVAKNYKQGGPKAAQLHRSCLASSIGLLEPPSGSSYWCQNLCPYVKKSPSVEIVDQGSTFYSTYFQSQEHQNWFGIDDQLGPVAISIKKEKIEESGFDKNHSLPSYQYRIIFRTAELFACQGTIREETITSKTDKSKAQGIREAIEYISPTLSLSCLRLGTNTHETEDALVKLDELGIHRTFKVGVLYCKAGQKTEEEMYNNENSGPAFSEFLEILGQRVRLKNFDKYRGGLDKKTDSTGNYSVYSQYQGCEIMFHISTLLPFTPSNKKQLLRKRHIGNDIVTIIFQEPGALPFSPKNIRSHFQHVFIVVQAINPCTENAMYSVSVSRFQDVPMFGPPIPDNGTFPKSRQFTDFLLAKVINGELAALRSEKFACMAARTKHEYLKDLTLNNSSATPLDSASKFSLMGFSRASKKERSRFKFVADSSVRGALSWSIAVEDATLQQKVDCVFAVSVDSVILFEEESASVIFSTSCRSILGWTLKVGQGIRLFYHQGECLSLCLRQSWVDSEASEILNEIIARLSAVTQGAQSQELVLKRNSAGLLGFNVQQDGIITEVEPYGLAATAKLEQGARLVEICTIALATLSQEQMVDLLKTSVTVTVTIIPPHVDGTPRRGCNVPTCHFLLGCSEGDYENLTPPEQSTNSHPKHRMKLLNRCDRSLSPPRSGSSSGYGTGSSSFSIDQAKAAQEAVYYHEELAKTQQEDNRLKYSSDFTGTMSSTSSGHSNDRWAEAVNDEFHGYVTSNTSTVASSSSHYYYEKHSSPPPLPARLYHQSKSSKKQGRQFLSLDSDFYDEKLGSLSGRNQSNYEHGNYAVPTAIPRPVNNVKNMSKGVEPLYSDYDNAYSSDVTKNPNYRRNSSPYTLESSREQVEPMEPPLNRELLMKSRHSVPKTVLSAQEKGLLDEQLLVSKSEDELSASSGSSPHGFQKTRGSGGSNSSPSLSSRTHSPHNVKGGDMGPPIARLKHGYSKSNRNSGATNNLQEDLLKLINPDYLSDSESIGAEIRDKKVERRETTPPNAISIDSVQPDNQGFETIGEIEFSNRKSVFTRSGRRLPRATTEEADQEKQSRKQPTNEGLLMTARPATVISNTSTASSPATFEKSSSVGAKMAERPYKEEIQELKTAPNLDLEWNTLVHTATRAIGNGGPILACSTLKKERSIETLTDRIVCPSEQNNLNDRVSTNANRPEDPNGNNEVVPSRCLQETIEKLEEALVVEKSKSGQLQEEVSMLRSENRKLQEDSRAAAQQLHQFTDWFFNTIDKGS